MRRGLILLVLGTMVGFVALSEQASAVGPVVTPAVIVKAANSPAVAAPIQPVRHRYYAYRPYYGRPYAVYRPYYRAYPRYAYRPYYRPRYYGYYYGPGVYYGGPTIYGAPGVYGYYGY